MPIDVARDAHVVEHRRTTRATAVPTVGVEEELLLLDPATGMVVPAADEVIRECRDPAHVVAESMRFMVETPTPVCPAAVGWSRRLSPRSR